MDELRVMTTFFIMPGDALKSLHSELGKLTGKEIAKGILFRFGFRCGESVIKRMGMKLKGNERIEEKLPALWAEFGLGRLEILESSKDELAIKFEESVEALALDEQKEPSCDFTRGYLAGVVSSLTSKKYYGVEKSCIAKGDSSCLHFLKLFQKE